jgi:hypothetical protein
MTTVLQPSNAFPGIPLPQHGSGNAIVNNFRYPGAVQPQEIGPTVLSWLNAFLGIPFPNHLTGMFTPQSFIYPGALQPISRMFLTVVAKIVIDLTVHEP